MTYQHPFENKEVCHLEIKSSILIELNPIQIFPTTRFRWKFLKIQLHRVTNNNRMK